MERAHLERAHEELCTALTTLRSNVDLVRVELRRALAGPGQVTAHLGEVEAAMTRLERLARQMRAWHDARA